MSDLNMTFRTLLFKSMNTQVYGGVCCFHDDFRGLKREEVDEFNNNSILFFLFFSRSNYMQSGVALFVTPPLKASCFIGQRVGCAAPSLN